MRKSSQRCSQIETFEKMLLMSASGIDGLADVDFLDAIELNELHEIEFPVPLGESVFADIPGTSTEPLSSNDAFLDRVVELTNDVRAANGLQALTTNSALQITAQVQSVNMAEQDFFSHTGQDGLMAWDRALNEGYNYQTIGENIAAGQVTPEEVVQGWVNSPGHLANILNPRFTEIGVGYQYLQSDTGAINYHHYWTQVFGTEFPSAEVELISDSPASDQPIEETSTTHTPPAAIEVEPPTDSPEPPAPPEPAEELSTAPPELSPATEVDSPAMNETPAEPVLEETIEAEPIPHETEDAPSNVTQPAPVDTPPPVETQPPVAETESSLPAITPEVQPSLTETESLDPEAESTANEADAVSTPPAVDPPIIAELPIPEPEVVSPPTTPTEPETVSPREEVKAPTAELAPVAPTADEADVVEQELAADQNRPPRINTTSPEPQSIIPAAAETQLSVDEQIDQPDTPEPAATTNFGPPEKRQNHKHIEDAVAEQVERTPAAIQQIAEFVSPRTNVAEVNFFDRAAQHQLAISNRTQPVNAIREMNDYRFSANHSWLDGHRNEGHSNPIVRQIQDSFRVKRHDADDHELNNESGLIAETVL